MQLDFAQVLRPHRSLLQLGQGLKPQETGTLRWQKGTRCPSEASFNIFGPLSLILAFLDAFEAAREAGHGNCKWLARSISANAAQGNISGRAPVALQFRARAVQT